MEDEDAISLENAGQSLTDIHEGIDISLRHAAAIVGLISIHPDLDDDVRESADAAAAHLREAREYAEELNDWRAKNEPTRPLQLVPVDGDTRP